MGCLVLLSRFDDSLQLVRPFGPGERRGILAVLFQVAKQKILEILLGTLHALRQCLPGENTEKAFHQVHPRGMRWCVVKMHPSVAQKPLFGGFVFVDVEVVQHYVEFPRWIGLHDIVHETQEVDPRTLWACQEVASLISARLAPFALAEISRYSGHSTRHCPTLPCPTYPTGSG
jgi:hypothetical protein